VEPSSDGRFKVQYSAPRFQPAKHGHVNRAYGDAGYSADTVDARRTWNGTGAGDQQSLLLCKMYLVPTIPKATTLP